MCSTVVVNRALFWQEVLERYGLWHGDDTLWWLKILSASAHARGLRKPLVFYRDAEVVLSMHVARNQLSIWRIHCDDFAHSVAFALVAYASYVADVALRRLRYRICTKFYGRLKISEVDL